MWFMRIYNFQHKIFLQMTNYKNLQGLFYFFHFSPENHKIASFEKYKRFLNTFAATWRQLLSLQPGTNPDDRNSHQMTYSLNALDIWQHACEKFIVFTVQHCWCKLPSPWSRLWTWLEARLQMESIFSMWVRFCFFRGREQVKFLQSTHIDSYLSMYDTIPIF